MKKETFLRRIKKNLFTKKGTIARIYHEPIMWLTNYPESKIHPCTWGNRWRSLVDKSAQYIEVLEALGIDYEEGNDAPKGGQTGNYIQLTAKGRRQVKDVKGLRLW